MHTPATWPAPSPAAPRTAGHTQSLQSPPPTRHPPPLASGRRRVGPERGRGSGQWSHGPDRVGTGDEGSGSESLAASGKGYPPARRHACKEKISKGMKCSENEQQNVEIQHTKMVLH